MATYTIRGTSHNVVYTYKAADGKRKQQWESYSSELEAIQRKAYIDYLQSQNRASDITHERLLKFFRNSFLTLKATLS